MRLKKNKPQKEIKSTDKSIKSNLFICSLFFLGLFSIVPFPAVASKLNDKKTIVDKYLKTKNPFEKKIKALTVFQSWADSEILSNADKLSDDELTQIMQYSNLLKALEPKKLTPKNCKAASAKVLAEDASPMNVKASIPAQSIVNWLKMICP